MPLKKDMYDEGDLAIAEEMGVITPQVKVAPIMSVKEDRQNSAVLVVICVCVAVVFISGLIGAAAG